MQKLLIISIGLRIKLKKAEARMKDRAFKFLSF
ncbi:hypothetical protein NF27_CG00990 [Candidatus Jidaibacter acanthamoeba]|uniref:Uncharacterized protein n=1 Tax=Candidatus Jidaibacter acanthamoebae TaxID=86105 RepID=A0A0C1QK39_9RICK|nr:hypothetical protein NF27_CG00990 [Candidatus Jidaibacter acanthamoeba]